MIFVNDSKWTVMVKCAAHELPNPEKKAKTANPQFYKWTVGEDRFLAAQAHQGCLALAAYGSETV